MDQKQNDYGKYHTYIADSFWGTLKIPNSCRSYSFFLFRPDILIMLFLSKSMLLILIIQANYVEINLKNNYYLLYNNFLRLKLNAYLIIILEG